MRSIKYHPGHVDPELFTGGAATWDPRHPKFHLPPPGEDDGSTCHYPPALTVDSGYPGSTTYRLTTTEGSPYFDRDVTLTPVARSDTLGRQHIYESPQFTS